MDEILGYTNTVNVLGCYPRRVAGEEDPERLEPLPDLVAPEPVSKPAAQVVKMDPKLRHCGLRPGQRTAVSSESATSRWATATS